MLVIARKLRRHGLKLDFPGSSEAVRGRLIIVRGDIVTARADQTPRRSVMAYLHQRWPPDFPGQSYFPPLSFVGITRMDSRGFVIVGEEMVMVDSLYQVFQQAWGCSPIKEGDTSPIVATAGPPAAR